MVAPFLPSEVFYVYVDRELTRKMPKDDQIFAAKIFNKVWVGPLELNISTASRLVYNNQCLGFTVETRHSSTHSEF
jgi:hypothetical protein